MTLDDVRRDEIFNGLVDISLTKKEKEIISCRYGLTDGTPKSFDEVAEILNVDPETVKSAERKALIELRSSNNSTKLRNAIIVSRTSDRKETRIKDQRSKRDIYSYYYMNTEEEIDDAIARLTEEEQRLLIERYGYDFKNPEFNEISKKKARIINNHIFPKIQMILDGAYEDDEDLEDRPFDKEAYVKSMRALHNMGIESVIENTSNDDAEILSLAFGAVDEKYYTPDEITQAISVPKEKVIQAIRNGLSRYEKMSDNTIKNVEEALQHGRAKTKTRR